MCSHFWIVDLIDDKIAKIEGLLKTSNRPTAISVVGGGNIKAACDHFSDSKEY